MKQEISELNEILSQLKQNRKEFDRNLEESAIDSSGIRIKLEKIRDVQEELYEVLILIQSNHETELKITKRKLKDNNSDIVDAIQESINKLKHALHALEDINEEDDTPIWLQLFDKLNLKKLILLVVTILSAFSILVAAYQYFPEATKWAVALFYGE